MDFFDFEKLEEVFAELAVQMKDAIDILAEIVGLVAISVAPKATINPVVGLSEAKPVLCRHSHLKRWYTAATGT